MIKIDSQLDEKRDVGQNTFVTCPVCGQKLTDVRKVEGSVLLRTVCRRCRNYIKIRITIE
nr:MAG TPA: cysteine-rich protein [Caudoviricetes sp.]